MKILIVEDEQKIANSIKKGLEQESFIVDVTYNGEDGYDLASSEAYDLIILDRMLPGMDGIDLCKRLRKEGTTTPVLMLTARGQLVDKVEGLNIGADDYIVKPFEFEELLARMRAVARRPKKSVEMILSVGDLFLDTIKYTVERGGERIHLSSKEFALLNYLMRNANTVVTKEQIIHQVWSYDADVLPNTVEVYIGYLRNKIDKPFANRTQLIHTVRGFGYKIGAK